MAQVAATLEKGGITTIQGKFSDTLSDLLSVVAIHNTQEHLEAAKVAATLAAAGGGGGGGISDEGVSFQWWDLATTAGGGGTSRLNVWVDGNYVGLISVNYILELIGELKAQGLELGEPPKQLKS